LFLKSATLFCVPLRRVAECQGDPRQRGASIPT
jgi:hypothetical protein